MAAARLQGEDRLVAWLRAAAGSGADLLGDDAAFLSDLGDVAVTIDAAPAVNVDAARLDAVALARLMKRSNPIMMKILPEQGRTA